jgi:GH24 family phage-related lysozyme (muramidase)
MDAEKLKAELIEDEGYDRVPYKDTKGIWTGGIGHNLEAHGIPLEQISEWLSSGIPEATVDEWFIDDIASATNIAQAIFGDLEALPDPAARTLVNMAFDLAWELREWHHLVQAVRESDWQAASASILASKWDHEGKGAANRCERLAARIGSS